jgi:hypothetical protein
MVPTIVLFFLLFDDFLNVVKFRFAYFFRNTVLLALFAASVTLLFYSTAPTIAWLKYFLGGTAKSVIDIPRAKGFYDNSELAQSQASAVKYIQSRTLPDEKIFVGNLRHDKVVNSDVMFYFLSGRHAATGYYELHPGVTNTRSVQRQIIHDLENGGVKYIILWSGAEDVNEPNASNAQTDARDLDDFIGKNYRLEKNIGVYSILTKRRIS